MRFGNLFDSKLAKLKKAMTRVWQTRHIFMKSYDHRDGKLYDGSVVGNTYIDSRYSEHFEITEEELDWLANEVEKLKTVVKEICKTHIAQLRVKVGSD